MCGRERRREIVAGGARPRLLSLLLFLLAQLLFFPLQLHSAPVQPHSAPLQMHSSPLQLPLLLNEHSAKARRCAVGPPKEGVEEVLERVMTTLQESGMVAEEDLVEVESLYRGLARSPLEINRASREELSAIALLSDFQIESIISYREKHGPILSVSELSLLHGFDLQTAELLSCFVVFGESYAPVRTEGAFSNRLYLKYQLPLGKGDSTLLGPNWSLLIKERMEYHLRSGVKLLCGVVAEKDIGEMMNARRPFDNLSFNLSVEGIRVGKRTQLSLLAGDYKVRLGQGLTIWKGFSIASGDAPLSLYKRGREVLPNNSSDEDNYLRGAALWGRSGRVSFVAFLSRRLVDAKINERGEYTSLQSGGLHNTLAALAKRQTMGEVTAGSSVKYNGDSFIVALNAVARRYGYDCGVKRREDNRLLLYNGWNSAVSLSYAAAIRGAMLYGEVAVSHNGAIAALSGCGFRPWRGAELGILCRGYSIAYVAPHSGAFSTLSAGPHNQYGADFNLLQRVGSGWIIKGGGSYTYSPWARYNIAPESSRVASFLSAEGMVGPFALLFKASELWNAGKNSFRIRTSAGINLNAGLHLRLAGNGAAGGGGFGWSLSGRATYGVRRLTMVCSALYFDAPLWECRIYEYERDLPQSYASQLLYGKGYKVYLYLAWKPSRWLALHIKGEHLGYLAPRNGEWQDSNSRIKLGLQVEL